MRFVQFDDAGKTKVGVETESGGNILDLSKNSCFSYKTMVEFLRGGTESLEAAKRAIESGVPSVNRNQVKLSSPITHPDKVICVGMNYRDHCEEQGAPLPIEPVIFNKFPSCIVGPYDDVLYPDVTQELDWEVELAFVIGKKGHNITKEAAMQHVFGFTVAHDVSARDWQLKRNGGQWLLGKTMDSFCPLGPVLVTTDEIKDPHNLAIKCRVNGVTKQDGNTKELVHKTQALVQFISQFVTLLPGDVVLTGTPPGVGCFRKPPEYLQRGDVVECEIENIGTIVNKIL